MCAIFGAGPAGGPKSLKIQDSSLLVSRDVAEAKDLILLTLGTLVEGGKNKEASELFKQYYSGSKRMIRLPSQSVVESAIDRIRSQKGDAVADQLSQKLKASEEAEMFADFGPTKEDLIAEAGPAAPKSAPAKPPQGTTGEKDPFSYF